uniref:NSP4 n=1 Tax=Crocidura shantungensis seadorna-like virus 2 TaxID=3139546 RepID=A0AB38ZK62_9REOV
MDSQNPAIDVDNIVQTFLNGTFSDLQNKINSLSVENLTFQIIITLCSVLGVSLSTKVSKKVYYCIKLLYYRIFRITDKKISDKTKVISNNIEELDRKFEDHKINLITEMQKLMSENDCFDYKKTYDELKIYYESKVDEFQIKVLKLENKYRNFEMQLDIIKNKIFSEIKSNAIEKTGPKEDHEEKEETGSIHTPKNVKSYKTERMD